MAENKSRRILEIFVLITGAILYLLTIGYNINIYDEGIAIVGAERVAHGEMPYRDFWTMYTPLSYYINAFWMSITGWTVISSRILASMFTLGTCLIIYFSLRKYTSNFIALAGYLFSIVMLFLSSIYSRPGAIALFLGALAVFLLMSALETDSARKMKRMIFTVTAGLLSGLTFLTKQDTGLYLILSILLSALLLWVAKIKYGSEFPKLVNYSPAFLLYLLGGFIIIIVPFTVYFLQNVPFVELYNQLYYTPLHIYPAYRELPAPSITKAIQSESWSIMLRTNWFILYRMIVVVTISYLMDIFKKSKINHFRIDSVFMLFFSAFSLFLFMVSFVRPDEEHLLPYFLMAIPIMFVSFYDDRKNRIVKWFAIVVLILIASMPLAVRGKTMYELFTRDKLTSVGSSRAKLIKVPMAWGESLNKAVRFIQDNTKKNDKIFVCTERNDKLVYNDVMFYFLAERLPAVRFHELHPGISTEAPQQKEMTESIDKNNVKFIVRFSGNSDMEEPNKSNESSYVHILDSYINNNYFRVVSYGDYSVLMRK